MPFPSLSALKGAAGKDQAHALDQSNAALDDGGRILRAVVRPYPAKVAGVTLRWAYDLNTGRAEFDWEAPKGKEPRCRESEVFFPAMLLAGGREVIVDGLERAAWKYNEALQTLFILPPPSEEGTRRQVVIRVDPPLEPLFVLTTHWHDFAGWYAAAGGLVLAVLAVLIRVWMG